MAFSWVSDTTEKHVLRASALLVLAGCVEHFVARAYVALTPAGYEASSLYFAPLAYPHSYQAMAAAQELVTAEYALWLLELRDG